MSFGIAGALAPDLRAGDVVISAEVVSEGNHWRADEWFQARVADLAREIGAFQGPVLGAAAILATEARQEPRLARYGCTCRRPGKLGRCRVATRLGIPFLVARTIADAACRELPPAALIPLSETGTPNLRKRPRSRCCAAPGRSRP